MDHIQPKNINQPTHTHNQRNIPGGVLKVARERVEPEGAAVVGAGERGGWEVGVVVMAAVVCGGGGGGGGKGGGVVGGWVGVPVPLECGLMHTRKSTHMYICNDEPVVAVVAVGVVQGVGQRGRLRPERVAAVGAPVVLFCGWGDRWMDGWDGWMDRWIGGVREREKESTIAPHIYANDKRKTAPAADRGGGEGAPQLAQTGLARLVRGLLLRCLWVGGWGGWVGG